MPSSRRPAAASSSPPSGQPPEILSQLGRAVLSYSLKKLNEQKARTRSREQSSRRKPSRSKTRDASRRSDRATSRGDMPRGDSGDMHTLVSQLAVGAVAFGIRHFIRRRREAKRQAAAASSARANTARGLNDHSESPGLSPAVDPELSAALDTVTRELQGASDNIKRLAHSAPSHRNCDVRNALVADAEKLTGSLANMQASIHNMRNLHPSLERERRRGRSQRGRQERTRSSRPEDDTSRTMPGRQGGYHRTQGRGPPRMEEPARKENDKSRSKRSPGRGNPAEPPRSRPSRREEETRSHQPR